MREPIITPLRKLVALASVLFLLTGGMVAGVHFHAEDGAEVAAHVHHGAEEAAGPEGTPVPPAPGFPDDLVDCFLCTALSGAVLEEVPPHLAGDFARTGELLLRPAEPGSFVPAHHWDARAPPLV